MSEFQLNVLPSSSPKNGGYAEAKGGTELMYHELMARLDPKFSEKFNIILSRVRPEFFDGRPTILWLHDLPEDPESQHLRDPKSRARFVKIVFNSYWQQYDYHIKLGIPLQEGIVLKNAIESFPANLQKDLDGPFRLIYFSTPHRGLHILEAAVRAIYNVRQDFVVDVYSSFELYGWKQRDLDFQPLFNRLKTLPCVNLHGTVSNQEIRQALMKSHILAYPSTYIESSCRVAIESMAAGLLTVVPNYGALTETCTDFAYMYNWDPDAQKHTQKFAQVLLLAMDNYKTEYVQNMLKMQSSYYNHFFGWDMRALQWTDFLRTLEYHYNASSR
jgi:UDP-glucose:(glucosyl)LPS alpha-1,2-glucosyltransferase